VRYGLVLACALIAAGCTGESALAPPISTETTAVTLPPTTTTTMTEFVALQPNGPVFLTQGDRNEYVEALQFYLVCVGRERATADGPGVSVDGVFGPITSSMVAYVQAEMRRVPTGSPDEETFASLARRCGATRSLEFPEDRNDRRVAGNVAPDGDEVLSIAGEPGRTLTIEVGEGAVQFSVRDPAGNVLHDVRDGPRWSGALSAQGEYRIRVTASVTASYSLLIEYPPPPRVAIDFGTLVLGPDGLGVVKFGDEPGDVERLLTGILGEPTSDSGWEGNARGCTGFNRQIRWVIDPAPQGSDHRAVFLARFSDQGFVGPAFAQWEYVTLDTDNVDIGSRSLATALGLSVGSTLTEFVALYGEPLILDRDRGRADFGSGMRVGIDLGGDAAPGFTERVWYLGAGQDGCPDFGS